MLLGLLKRKESNRNLEAKKSLQVGVGNYSKAHWSTLRVQYQKISSRIEKIKYKKNISRVILSECDFDMFTIAYKPSNLKFLKQFTYSSYNPELFHLKLLELALKNYPGLKKLELDIKEDCYFPLESNFKSKKFKSLINLDIRFYRINNSIIYQFFKGFSALNRLQKIELHVFLDKEPIDRGLRKVPQYFNRIKQKIESFTLQVSSNADLNMNLNSLFKGLSYLESLRKIKMQFQTPIKSNLNDIQMSNFLTTSKFEKLETFIIYLPSSQRITDQTLFRFGDCFYNLKSIKSLQLKFASDEITDAGVWKLNSLINLEGLENLQICFVGCENVSNASIRSLFRSIEKLIKLKSLSFNFMNSKVSESSLKDLHICFGKSKIEIFSLCIRNCKNLDHHLSFISGLIGLQLKSFSLDASQTKIVFKKLCSFIQSLINLEDLSLSFSKSNLSDCDFIDLLESFPALHKLKKLSLLLDENPISNVTLYTLVQSLTPLRCISELQLGLRGCTKLTSEAFVELGLLLKKVSLITTLKLNFYACAHFDETTLLRYGEFISQLANLERFEFILDACVKLTSESLIQFSQFLTVLKKLKLVDIKTAKTKCKYSRIQNLESFKSRI